MMIRCDQAFLSSNYLQFMDTLNNLCSVNNTKTNIYLLYTEITEQNCIDSVISLLTDYFVFIGPNVYIINSFIGMKWITLKWNHR